MTTAGSFKFSPEVFTLFDRPGGCVALDRQRTVPVRLSLDGARKPVSLRRRRSSTKRATSSLWEVSRWCCANVPGRPHRTSQAWRRPGRLRVAVARTPLLSSSPCKEIWGRLRGLRLRSSRVGMCCCHIGSSGGILSLRLGPALI